MAHKVTWIGFIFGVFIVVISTIRWFIIYPDMSQFIIGVLLGITILAFTYTHEWMKLTDKYIHNLTQRLDSLVYNKK